MPPDESTTTERADPGSPSDWLRYARSDLRLSREEQPEGVLSEALCFHAQQAAEKAVKAVLVSEGIPVPYIHDIGTLFDRLPKRIEVPPDVRKAVRLTDYAVFSRYPADLAPVDDEEHRRAVQWAEATVAWAEKHVDAVKERDDDG
ncbi:MAG: DNA-binding protein [Bacteroidetes bacterium QS_7_67_15]|nr:MAG: DNA-binding protein [Bacteroidetes bacterium QS_7_67_15]